MISDNDLNSLVKAAREAERITRDSRNATAHAAEMLRPQMDEIARTVGPSMIALQQAVDAIISAFDYESLQKAASDALAGVDLQELRELEKFAQLHAEQWSSLARKLNSATAVAIAHGQVSSKTGSLDTWRKRWTIDASYADRAFAEMAESVRAARAHGKVPQNAELVPENDNNSGKINMRDVDIAELYYRGLLTQQQIGDTVGLTQASVAGKLRKTDRVIAEIVVRERLQRIAKNEGWNVVNEGSVRAGGAAIRFDVMATKRVDDRPVQLGIEIKVVGSTTAWVSIVDKIRGWSEYLDSVNAPAYPVLAIYDLSEHHLHLCLEADLLKAQSLVAGKQSLDSLKFRTLRAFLSGELSLDAVLKRAQE